MELGGFMLGWRDVGSSRQSRWELHVYRLKWRELVGNMTGTEGSGRLLARTEGSRRLKAEEDGAQRLQAGTKRAQRIQAAEYDAAPSGWTCLQD